MGCHWREGEAFPEALHPVEEGSFGGSALLYQRLLADPPCCTWLVPSKAQLGPGEDLLLEVMPAPLHKAPAQI